MVSGQNEAERHKGEAEILSKDLQQQNDRIAQRRHQVRNETTLPLFGVTDESPHAISLTQLVFLSFIFL